VASPRRRRSSGRPAGIALGCLAVAIAAHAAGNLATVPVAAPPAGLSSAITVGMLAGIYPAARAARLAPAQAPRTI
jgi:putative ABC transport system permease protein